MCLYSKTLSTSTNYNGLSSCCVKHAVRHTQLCSSSGSVTAHRGGATGSRRKCLLVCAQVLQGKPFILKSLAYDSVHRADLFKLPCAPSKLEAYLARPDITISSKQPWILQEFLKVCEHMYPVQRSNVQYVECVPQCDTRIG